MKSDISKSCRTITSRSHTHLILSAKILLTRFDLAKLTPEGHQSQSRNLSPGATVKLSALGGFLLLMFGFGTSGWCDEQIGPDRSAASLSETQDWLRRQGPGFTSKIVGQPCVRWSFSSNCRLHIEWGPLVEEINLSALDPASFHVRFVRTWGSEPDWNLYMTDNGLGAIRFISKTDGSAIADQLSKIGHNIGWVGAVDKDAAIRLGRALKHAAFLCGGKVDPF